MNESLGFDGTSHRIIVPGNTKSSTCSCVMSPVHFRFETRFLRMISTNIYKISSSRFHHYTWRRYFSTLIFIEPLVTRRRFSSRKYFNKFYRKGHRIFFPSSLSVARLRNTFPRKNDILYNIFAFQPTLLRRLFLFLSIVQIFFSR